MVARMIITLTLAALLVELSPANSSSNSGTRLTPSNVRTQRLDFVIHAEKIGVLTRFMVSVQNPTTAKPPTLAGYLLLLDGKTKLASCPVAPAKKPKNVVYEFLVNNKHLAQSRFLLEENDARKKGVPVAEQYWFYLQDFALAKVSATTAPGAEGRE